MLFKELRSNLPASTLGRVLDITNRKLRTQAENATSEQAHNPACWYHMWAQFMPQQETLPTPRQYGTEGFKGDPQLVPNHAERRQPLGRPMRRIPVWLVKKFYSFEKKIIVKLKE